MTDKTLLVLNGPGLAELSDVDGFSYGSLSLQEIRDACSALCEQLGIGLDFRQTDDEAEMTRWIAKDSRNFDALIINPVGYSRVASVEVDLLRSAITKIAHEEKPLIEVHISNIFREGADTIKPLRVSEAKLGFICGLGVHSYLLAIKAAAKRLQK